MDLLRRKDVPALAVQAAMQLLKYLLRRYDLAQRFLVRNGIATLTSVPASSHFAGAFCHLSCVFSGRF